MKIICSFFFSFTTCLSLAQSVGPNGSQVGHELNTITTAVPFLLITPDARAGALGEAGCASTPDVYSNYWNASKNAFIEKRNGISFSYTPWLRALVPDINLFELSSYIRLGNKNTIGVSGRYFSLGDITYTTISGNPIGQIHPFEYTGSISFARKIKNNFSIGFAGKYIHSNLLGNLVVAGLHAGQSVAIDLSCYKRDTINFIKQNDVFAWGITIANIGQKISYSDRGEKDFIPQNLKIGISDKITLDEHNSLEILLDLNKLLVPTPPVYETDSVGNPVTAPSGAYVIARGKDPDRGVFNALYTSFYDAPGGPEEELHEVMVASGIEYWYDRMVAVRAGYFYEHETKGGRKYITLGIGGRYRGIKLDVAYLIPVEERHPLQDTWRASLSWEFNRICKKKD